MNITRYVQIKKDNSWFNIEFNELKKGDTFRLFEDEDKKVPIEFEGRTEFLATSDPYPTKTEDAQDTLSIEFLA